MSGHFTNDTEVLAESDDSVCSVFPSCDWASSCKGDHSFSGPTDSKSGSFDSYYDTKTSYFARKQIEAELEKKKREGGTSKAAEKGKNAQKSPVVKKDSVLKPSPKITEKAPLIIILSDDESDD